MYHGRADEHKETRACHYCRKMGHLAAACKKKARDEGKGQKTAAAITQGTASALSTSKPSTSTTAAAISQHSPQDLAAAIAVLVQQALENRRSSVGKPVFDVSAVTSTEAARCEWPDTDDEVSVCPLLQVTAASPASSGEELWALYDSVSGLTMCPADSFLDLELVRGSYRCSLEAATGDAVKPIGRRKVNFLGEAGGTRRSTSR